MMASGEGLSSVPPEDVPEPRAGFFRELFAKLEARSAELQRLAALGVQSLHLVDRVKDESVWL
jgi:hypothetical protein